MSAVAVPPIEFDRQLAERLEQALDLDALDSWWCVRTRPWPCPAQGCDFVALFLTAIHRVVVWPAKDDLALLRRCDEAQQLDREPKVVRYQEEFGPALSWDAWQTLGGPVHALARKPPGFHKAGF